MIKEAFGIADTVEEAKEAAIAELNAGIDADISFEIIDMPKKKLLGVFGGSKAKVRAYVEIAEKEKKKQKPQKKAPQVRTNKEETIQKPKAAKVEKEAKPVKNDSVYSDAVDYTELEANTPAHKAVNYLIKVL